MLVVGLVERGRMQHLTPSEVKAGTLPGFYELGNQAAEKTLC